MVLSICSMAEAPESSSATVASKDSRMVLKWTTARAAALGRGAMRTLARVKVTSVPSEPTTTLAMFMGSRSTSSKL